MFAKRTISAARTALVNASRSNSAASANVFCRGFSDKGTALTETVRDFLEPKMMYDMLEENQMDFYTGVPDSLLKDFCAYVTDHAPAKNHVMSANEGSAVGIASGYHLATGRSPIVYMQNSGFGNTVNPLLSLADPKIYSIPMLLLIGWRGEPGKKDEPQHRVQGSVMSSLLTDMGIKYEVLPDYEEGAREAVSAAAHHLQHRQSPYALLVKRQTFAPYKLQSIAPNEFEVNREEALNILLPALADYDITVSTTGFTSREVFEYRVAKEQGHKRDFLTVGSMGHASAISLGIAISKPSRQVVTIDGDGAALMHMGNLATAGLAQCPNYKHILINNGAHDSVGGQPTGGFNIDFCGVAKATGYKNADSASTAAEIESKIRPFMASDGPSFLEIKVNKGARKNLGRPTTTPLQNKKDFMRFLTH